MKQPKIILLIVILILLFTACRERDLGLSSSSASSGVTVSQPQSDAQSAESSSPVSQSSESAEEAAERYADILRSDTYYIDCTAVVEFEGMRLENPMLIAVRDGNSSISVSSDLSGALVTIRTLVYDGNVYQIDDTQRSYLQIDPEQSANSFDTDFSELAYIGEDTGDFLGETLPCLKYERQDQIIRLFLDGNALLGMTQSITDEQASEITLKINGISTNLPSHLVEIPMGYTKE